jgi:uncharacterized membrane protein YhaH (DUF805 family)
MRVPSRYRSDLQRTAQEYLDLRRRDARADNWIVVLALALIMSVTLFLDGVFRRSADGGTVVDSGAIGVIVLIAVLGGVAIVKRAIHLRIRALRADAGKLGFHLSGGSGGKGVTCYWGIRDFLFDPMNSSYYATR